jgi:hypothetical protein
VVASPARENIPLFQANHGGVPADFLVSGSGGGDYGYYRQPNGWITVSPIGKNNTDLHRYQDEGWVPLVRQYGPFDFPREYYANHPFEVLFLRGGAHEMPVAQIKALGYDRNPPKMPRCNLALGEEHAGPTKRPIHFDRCWMGAQPVVFPQLAGLEPDAVPPCEFCERDDFTSRPGREQHMRVLHIEELREISAAREMAKGMREAMVLGVQGITGVNQALAGSGLPIAGMAARPFGCGFCGETFEKMRGQEGLEAHVKLHEEAGDGGA